MCSVATPTYAAISTITTTDISRDSPALHVMHGLARLSIERYASFTLLRRRGHLYGDTLASVVNDFALACFGR